MRYRVPWWIGPLALLSLAVMVKVVQPPLLVEMQLKVFDFYQTAAPRAYEEVPVRIVDIDDASIEKIGQWPWPRTTLARMVSRLREQGAAAVVFDIVFAEADRTAPRQILPLWNIRTPPPALAGLPDHDALFADALGELPSVTGMVLTQNSARIPQVKAGFSYTGEDPLPYVPSFTGTVPTLPEMEAAAKGNGVLNSDPDRDGILRRIPMLFRVGSKLYPSLSAEALRVAQGAGGFVVKSVGASDEMAGSSSRRGITAIKIGRLEVPTDMGGRFWLYYTHHVPERYLPAWKVIAGEAERPLVEGHIVLVGTTAAGLKDLRATPLNPSVGGVEVHAQALEQMLLGVYLTRPDWVLGAEILFMLLAGAVTVVVISRLNALWAAAFMLCMLLMATAVSWYCFRSERLLIEPVTPGIAIMLLYSVETLRRFRATEEERGRIRNAFSLYMSPALADQLSRHPERLALGGEKRDISIMFCDIREFSAISECLEPVELTRFINSFLTPMTEVLMRHGGTVDKYIGDCIMALWNAPLEQPGHPESAARAALAMRDTLQAFNDALKASPGPYARVPMPIRMGVGINSGECCVGNMGSTLRFEYSALGNEVDMASRLEGLCKLYGVDILIGQHTRESVGGMATLEMDLIRVKGKSVPVHIHALLGSEAMAQDAAFRALAAEHAAMLEAYRGRRWEEASRRVESSMELALRLESLRLSVCYRLYAERAAFFSAHPPAEDWDGVFQATSK